MAKLKVGVIELITNGENHSLYGRVAHANFASIMPQVIASWCDQRGHEVEYTVFTGFEDLEKIIPDDRDIVFIGAFTHAALLAYALSNLLRSKGIVTVLGGPHARCYPDDAIRYFDYVAGFTNEEILDEILDNCVPQKPVGTFLASKNQPVRLASMRERWKFAEPVMKKAPLFKVVSMIGSMGCPYTCSFCVDAAVKYQPLDFDSLREDLQFLLTKIKNPIVAWHDPHFGIRFDEYMEVIATAAPGGKIRHIAESSLSILSEDRLKVMKENGFSAMAPGIESWYEMGNKSNSMRKDGEEKLYQVAEHVNLIMKYIPYLQANFVLGLDSYEGFEPFDLSKRFVDMAPASFPAYSLITSFGEGAPHNLEYQKENRIIPFPFHFMNTYHTMTIKPKHYDWVDFYDKIIDLFEYTFSAKAIYRRFMKNEGWITKYFNLIRGISSNGRGKLKYNRMIRQKLIEDVKFRDFFEGETTEIPQFYQDMIREDLGILWKWLPEGAMYHNPNAYLEKMKKSGELVG
ncbi:MAG: radical SAM protein [Bacteroidia bacterium]